MLRDIIPAKYRKQVYAMYAVGAVLIGSVQVGYLVAEEGQPVWLKVAFGVWAYLGGALGLVAASNVNRAAEEYTLPGDPNTRWGSDE